MTNQPPPPSAPEDPEDFERLPCAPDAERDLVGAVLYDEVAFERAGLKSSDFFTQRWRWVWEAYEAIRAGDDHIDESPCGAKTNQSGGLPYPEARFHLYLPAPAAVHEYARRMKRIFQDFPS